MAEDIADEGRGSRGQIDEIINGGRETKAGLIVLGFKYYLSHLIHSF